MTTSTLSAERARELFSYDPATGVITRRVAINNSVKAGAIAGSHQSNGYLRVRVDGVLLHAHRLAWLLHTGAWPLYTVDHINGVRSDNRLCNLRDIPKSVNNQNIRGRKSKTGLQGVGKSGLRFTAKITTLGDQTYLGTFGTPREAHQAYLTAKRNLHVGCTI